jgi:hypothetical protein
VIQTTTPEINKLEIGTSWKKVNRLNHGLVGLNDFTDLKIVKSIKSKKSKKSASST